MPKRPVSGTKQVVVELAVPLVDQAKAFAKERGETLKEVIGEALRRHLAYPPPPKAAPAPPPAPPPPEPFPVVPPVELVAAAVSAKPKRKPTR